MKLYYEAPRVKLYLGDARQLPVEDESIDMIATSPPYWGKRDYGEDVVTVWDDGWEGQLGLEPTWQLYIQHLCECAEEWWRVLKPTGNLFINIGDTFCADSHVRRSSKEAFQQLGDEEYEDCLATERPKSGRKRRDFTSQKSIPKMKLGIPYRLRFALNDMGWVSRDDIIWYKGKRYPDGKITKVAMPESVKDRMSCSYELLFHFVKEPKGYWFDLDAVRRPHQDNRRNLEGGSATQAGQPRTPVMPRERTAAGANPGDLFFIPPEEEEELIPFPFEVHRARLGVEEFKNLSAIVSRSISQLEDASSAVLSGFFDANPDGGEFIRNFGEELIRACKPDGKPAIVSLQAYATITIEQAPNEIRIELGRNRWILRSEAFARDDIKSGQVLRHRFAINLDSMSMPPLALVNWIRGFPLGLDILDQLNVLRCELDCRTGASDFDTAITDHQAEDISRVGSDSAKVFLVECVLAVALDYARIAMTIPAVPVHPAESSTLARSLAIINLTDAHASIIADSGAKVKTSSDVWIIQPEPFKEAHYAVWPSKLCERMIKVGCPREVCPKCGKPRERIVQKPDMSKRPTRATAKQFGERIHTGFNEYPQSAGQAWQAWRDANPDITIGWSDCGCGEDWVNGVILDPFFGGSGRIARVALNLGRDVIGVDMKEEYLEMAKDCLIYGEKELSKEKERREKTGMSQAVLW